MELEFNDWCGGDRFILSVVGTKCGVKNKSTKCIEFPSKKINEFTDWKCRMRAIKIKNDRKTGRFMPAIGVVQVHRSYARQSSW